MSMLFEAYQSEGTIYFIIHGIFSQFSKMCIYLKPLTFQYEFFFLLEDETISSNASQEYADPSQPLFTQDTADPSQPLFTQDMGHDTANPSQPLLTQDTVCMYNIILF